MLGKKIFSLLSTVSFVTLAHPSFGMDSKGYDDQSSKGALSKKRNDTTMMDESDEREVVESHENGQPKIKVKSNGDKRFYDEDGKYLYPLFNGYEPKEYLADGIRLKIAIGVQEDGTENYETVLCYFYDEKGKYLYFLSQGEEIKETHDSGWPKRTSLEDGGTDY